VYIAGNGHSGSTLLEFLLASSPQAVGLGEVASVVRGTLAGEAGAWRGQGCTCGARAEDCPFWSPVMDDLGAHARELGGAGGRRPSGDTLRTAGMSEGYRIVVEHFRRRFPDTTLIDSSKNPPSFGWFSSAMGGDAAAIHLIRDVRSWSTSTRRTVRRTSGRWRSLASPRAAAARAVHYSHIGRFVRWYRRNRLFDELFASRSEPVVRVSYEELATNPEVLESVFSALRLAPPDVLHQPHLADSHALAGNGALRSSDKAARTVYSTQWLADRSWLLPSLLMRRTMAYNAERVYGGALASNPTDRYGAGLDPRER
jgi:hypothetical protein